MRTINLYRTLSAADVTLGILVAGDLVLPTLELPWKNNARNVSCIPAGMYYCSYWSSSTMGNSYKLYDVPNRGGILIHAGNYIHDTEGCILVGTKVDNVTPRVLNSKTATNLLVDDLGTSGFFRLVISELF
jgi:hypothetical protein